MRIFSRKKSIIRTFITQPKEKRSALPTTVSGRPSGNILGYDLDAMNSDSINEGKVLFTLYKKTKDEKYRKAMEYVSIFSMQSSETLLVVPI